MHSRRLQVREVKVVAHWGREVLARAFMCWEEAVRVTDQLVGLTLRVRRRVEKERREGAFKAWAGAWLNKVSSPKP